MNKAFPILLWSLVVVFGSITLFYLNNKGRAQSDPIDGPSPGTIYDQIAWEHFQDVPPFQLVDQNGETFDSRKLYGRPFVVSFFFASCPTICRDLNKQVQALREQLDDPELVFLTITVDPEVDTPEQLNRYAADFDADVNDWKFLTGELYKIKEVGEQTFQVVVDKATHTDNILLVDRWGRYRDRFKWDDPYDTKRFIEVAKDILAEQEPPLGKSFNTRNLMAGVKPTDLKNVPWLREFHMTNQDGDPFYSRDLTGKVWIGNLFFTTCPGICPRQTEYLAGLQSRLKDHPAHLVSISTMPETDTPAVLKQYAQKMGANTESWDFLTGDKLLSDRVAGEYFKAGAHGDHHSSRLFVVDRWGRIRGDFDWEQPQDEVKMLNLIDQLNAETAPGAIK